MNIGWGEILVILVIALLIVGPRRLPDVGRSLGQAIREFKRAMRGDRSDDDKTNDQSKEPR